MECAMCKDYVEHNCEGLKCQACGRIKKLMILPDPSYNAPVGPRDTQLRPIPRVIKIVAKQKRGEREDPEPSTIDRIRGRISELWNRRTQHGIVARAVDVREEYFSPKERKLLKRINK